MGRSRKEFKFYNLRGYLILTALGWVLFSGAPHLLFAQLSPGDLAEVHAHLEGLSNCTQCHTLGNKVTNDKCLACHTEVKIRIEQNTGYHASREVKGKTCVTCHSDHHGRKFEIVRFKPEAFDHTLSGYPLEGAHTRAVCADCHQPANIREARIREKKFTYMGLSRECQGCHEDYHQATLPVNCSQCHGMEAFKPAERFSHDQTRFALTGKHKEVECQACHPVISRNDKPFQEFRGIRFSQCSVCHTDAHQGRFGTGCSDCHTTASFYQVKGMEGFDHSRTGFILENKHASLPCTACHKQSLTAPVKHEKCTDCHEDYHEGEFLRTNEVQSCADCHTTRGFTQAAFTIEEHNNGPFVLKGAHLATPCFDCHKTTDKWQFRSIGIRCADCHKDIHYPEISPSYYPDAACDNCHEETAWTTVSFDHNQTLFPLTGKHVQQSCRRCHQPAGSDGNPVWKFASLNPDCQSCHPDNHSGQFDQNGSTDCRRCHETENWNIDPFDHNRKTAFVLEGRHAEIPCGDCHKSVTRDGNTFILYKLGGVQCENCH